LVLAVRANASPNEPDVAISGLDALAKLKAKAGVPLAREMLAASQPRVRESARGLLAAVLGDSAARAEAAARGPAPWRAVSIAPYEALPAGPTRAVIRTSRGPIEIELFAADAPLTVANFAKLARRGYYDRTRFHRVVPNFVIQDGDPTSTGWGGPGYAI